MGNECKKAEFNANRKENERNHWRETEVRRNGEQKNVIHSPTTKNNEMPMKLKNTAQITRIHRCDTMLNSS